MVLNLPCHSAKSILFRNATSIFCFRVIIIFPPETRFLKSFTTNILSQFRSLQGEWPRSRGVGGGGHYHHIWPVKSCLTDFTQILPLVKCYISTPFGFWIYKWWSVGSLTFYIVYMKNMIRTKNSKVVDGVLLLESWIKFYRLLKKKLLIFLVSHHHRFNFGDGMGKIQQKRRRGCEKWFKMWNGWWQCAIYGIQATNQSSLFPPGKTCHWLRK